MKEAKQPAWAQEYTVQPEVTAYVCGSAELDNSDVDAAAHPKSGEGAGRVQDQLAEMFNVAHSTGCASRARFQSLV